MSQVPLYVSIVFEATRFKTRSTNPRFSAKSYRIRSAVAVESSLERLTVFSVSAFCTGRGPISGEIEPHQERSSGRTSS